MRNTIAKAKILELINHSEVALSHSEIEKLRRKDCVTGLPYTVYWTG